MLVLMASSSGSGVNADTQCLQLVSDGRGHGVSHTCSLWSTGWHAKKKCPIVIRQMATPPLSYILFFKKTTVVILK